jgi:methyl-accepting chemotaxis protein
MKGLLNREAWARTKGAKGWKDRPGLVVVDTTSRDPEIIRGFDDVEDVPAAPVVLDRTNRRGAILERGAFPLVAHDGTVEGVVVTERDVTPLFEGMDDLRNRVVLLVALLALGLAAFIVFIVETLVFERINRMGAVLEALPERLARGDALADELVPRNDDEIGRFERFLARALETIGSFVAESRRDRDRKPPPRGFFDR